MSGRNAPSAWQADDSHAEIEPSAVLSRRTHAARRISDHLHARVFLDDDRAVSVGCQRADNPVARVFSGVAEPYLAPGLLAFTLLFVFSSAGEKALYFSPSEVDFLFPAPFHRRDLLMFKLSKMLFGLVFMALIFSISFLLYLNTWISAFVGCFLALGFVQLLALVSAFLGQIVAEQAYTRRRRMVLLAIGVLVLGALRRCCGRLRYQTQPS